MRRRARDVSRPGLAGDQALRLRSRGQRDAGLADPAHLGRSRHRPRSCRHGQGRPSQPRCRHPACAGYRGPPALRQTTMAYVRARKRFGQHFLHDPGVLHKIVRAITPRATDHIVEIGPGRGALTHALLEEWSGIPEGGTLDLIEIDRDLAPALRDEFADNPRITVHEADALEFDFAQLASERGGRLRIIGNLPYNISTPLLFHLLDSAGAIDDLHVMLQREVVERIAASPGSGDYGRLTV